MQLSTQPSRLIDTHRQFPPPPLPPTKSDLGPGEGRQFPFFVVSCFCSVPKSDRGNLSSVFLSKIQVLPGKGQDIAILRIITDLKGWGGSFNNELESCKNSIFFFFSHNAHFRL